MGRIARHPAVVTAILAGLLLLVITAANYHFWPLWFVWLALTAGALTMSARASRPAGRRHDRIST